MLTTRIRPIQSRQNSRVKELRTAMRQPGDRIALEGEHLLLEALSSGLTIETIFVVSGFEDRLEALPLDEETEILSLPAEILATAVTTETPQPFAALARPPVFALEDLFHQRAPLVIVAAGLQDPGNLGTLIRSAEAFGATGCILLPGTVSQWNAKALRASSGSAFRLPVVHCTATKMLTTMQQHGVKIFAAVASPDSDPNGMPDLTKPCAILIGNEGAGLSPELIAMADARITIPYPGVTESLNAAVAGSVFLYDASRQRRNTQ